MSQVVLGLRSLTIKLAIFFVMAALLAWALGGTLFPRPFVVELADRKAWLGEDQYIWRASTHERRNTHLDWHLYVGVSGSPADELAYPAAFRDVVGPVVIGEEVAIAFGGQRAGGSWVLVHQPRAGSPTEHAMPDRLAIEQQIERLANGLPVQETAAILAERPLVLDPASGNADQLESASPGDAD